MIEEKFWSLLALKLSGEASEEELKEYGELLKNEPGLGYKAEMLENFWATKHEPLHHSTDEAFNRHMQRLSNHLSEPVLQYESEVDETVSATPVRRINRKWFWFSSAAACIVMVFVALTLFNNSRSINPHANNTVSTKKGSKSKVQLPDGTQVWLNADSRITYKENFQDRVREVELSGEAFFDVVRDESRPFLIHTPNIDIKVLGTAFNVKAYDNDRSTVTSLIRGSVEVTLRNNPDKKIVLKPNEKLIVRNGDTEFGTPTGKNGKSIVEIPQLTLSKISFADKDSSAIETLWIKNKLAFDKEELEDIALKIERWYDVKVIISDEKLKKTEYSAAFENESLTEVMEALQMTGNFNYSINKQEVIIKP